MTERRERTARDYGPRTSTLLANQAHKFDRMLRKKDDQLFEQRTEIWRLKREVRALLLALEGKQKEAENERGKSWLDDD